MSVPIEGTRDELVFELLGFSSLSIFFFKSNVEREKEVERFHRESL